jgi:hypothetical protein
MRGPRIAASLAALVCLSGCTQSSPEPTQSGPTTTSSPSAIQSPSPSGPAQTLLASGEALPAECQAGSPKPADTLAFVAQGSAWSLNVKGTHLTCLFGVGDPGPFAWGPLGDRVLLGNLEVKGFGDALTSPGQAFAPGPASFGRPTGKSVVFTPPDGGSLQKVLLDTGDIQDVTPLDDSQYLSVIYHPSGLAFAFAIQRGERQSVWISSNVGEDARRLVFSTQGTTFGAVAFREDGESLYYGAQLPDGRPELHVVDLLDTSEAPLVWAGSAGQRVEDIRPGETNGAVAFTAGSSCDDETAMVMNETESDPHPAIPAETRPTRVLGWLNGAQVLVAAGGCDQPLDLSAVDAYADAVAPLVFGVDAAGVRTPAPTPPPPLPEGTGIGGSFG